MHLGIWSCINQFQPSLYASDVNNRVSDLKTFDDTMDAVGWGAIAYPDVDWRYTIMPSTPLPGDGKSFDPVCVEHVESCIKNGLEPAYVESMHCFADTNAADGRSG